MSSTPHSPDSLLVSSLDIVFVYVTFANRLEAERIALLAIENRLAACANVFQEHTSIYRWKDSVERQTECVAVFKTVATQASALSSLVLREHSFENPCIAVFNLSEITPAFANWIRKETTLTKNLNE